MKLPKIKIFWQSGKFFRSSGLFITIDGKKYNLIDTSKY